MTISVFEKTEGIDINDRCELNSIEPTTDNIELNQISTISRKRNRSIKGNKTNPTIPESMVNKRPKTSYFERSEDEEIFSSRDHVNCSKKSRTNPNDPNDPNDKIVFLVTDKNNNRIDDHSASDESSIDSAKYGKFMDIIRKQSRNPTNPTNPS